MKVFDCLREFRDSFDGYPSQDNEGYLPDRGAFKCGFFACYRKLNPLFMKAKMELDALKAERDELKVRIEQHRGALGYAVPGHIKDDPSINNGLAEAIAKQRDALINDVGDYRKALESTVRERDALRAALEFYAELEDWGHNHDSDSKCDYGDRARKALGKQE